MKPQLIIIVDPQGIAKIRFASHSVDEEKICFLMFQRIRPVLLKIPRELQKEFPEYAQTYDLVDPILRCELGLADWEGKKKAPEGQPEQVG